MEPLLPDFAHRTPASETQRPFLGFQSRAALRLANLFGFDNVERTVRLITASLALVLDPLACGLTSAASLRYQALSGC